MNAASPEADASRRADEPRVIFAPGRMCVLLVSVMTLLLVGAIVMPWLTSLVLAMNLALLAGAWLSARTLGPRVVRIEREDWRRLEVDRPTQLTVRLENRGRTPVTVDVAQVWPAALDADPPTLRVTLAPGEVARQAWTVTARRRGRYALAPLDVDAWRVIDLGRKRWSADGSIAMTAFPSLKPVVGYEALRQRHGLQQMGLHRMRMVGAGREFDRLSDYQPDDQYTDINWKATARRRKPIVNTWRAERSQDVMLCIDTGRMMANPVGAMTVLDAAVDASVMLAHVCDRSGDRVGLMLFDDRVRVMRKPAAGRKAVTGLLENLVDAEARGVFTAFAPMAQAIRASQSRRSMIFVFTDLNDPQLASNLAEVAPVLARRHVMVVISLRDPLLEAAAGAGPRQERGLYQVLAAREFVDQRDARLRELTRAGVQVLDADADRLTLDVVNRYLQIKARQLV